MVDAHMLAVVGAGTSSILLIRLHRLAHLDIVGPLTDDRTAIRVKDVPKNFDAAQSGIPFLLEFQ